MILKVKDENGEFKEVVLKGLKGDKGDNIITSPNGTEYLIVVDNEGNLIKPHWHFVIKLDKEIRFSITSFSLSSYNTIWNL